MKRLTASSLTFLLVAGFPLIVRCQDTLPTPESSPGNSQEAVVIEQLNRRSEFQNDGTSVSETTYRARVQSDAGVKQLGLLVFQYLQASDAMDVVYVRVLKPDGTAVVTPAGNIQDLPADITREAPFYSDVRQKHVAVRGLSVGDRLEYKVRNRVHTPLIPGHFWVADDFTRGAIVLEETMEVSVPAGRPVKTKFSDLEPVVTEEGGRRIFRWKTSNLKRKTEEELAVQATDPPPPAVQLTTFQGYEEVGRWYEALQRERVEPTPEIGAKAAELTQNARTEDEKIRALYNYVALSFRYIGIGFGIGRYQPNTAADVLANQYGDCKDKHTLLASLLKAVGISAYPALINSSRKMDPDIPSPSQFDHVITAVPRGDHYLWLDTTAEVSPFGLLLYGLRDKQALVLPPDKPAILVTTPAVPPFPNFNTFRIEGKLSDAGTFEAKVSRSWRGDAEVIMRAAFRRTPQPQWKDLAQAISYSGGFAGAVSNIDASPPEATDAPFRLNFDYTRKDYSEWKNHRLAMPCPSLGLPSLKDQEEEKRGKLTFGPPVEFVYQGRIELPGEREPRLPQAVDLQEDFAEYHSTYAFMDRALVSERRLIIKVKEISKEKFEAYREFADAVRDDERRYVDVTTPRIAKADLLLKADQMSADELNSAAADLLNEKKDFSLAADLLRKATDKDPKHKWAWNNLGRACAALGNLSEAEKAYKRQIEINPDDEYSYENLGWLLIHQERYDEAGAAYRKHLAIKPTDSGAYYNLGRALEKTGKFIEAADVYSKLAALKPQTPEPYVSWGHALLKAGRKGEGQRQMERALELDTSPSTLNNVAYFMAEAGLDLDKNEERAQRAVEAIVQALPAPLSLDRSPDYEQKLASLSAYLDTLGWVIFQKGELERSEPYLRASLQLFGGPAVAEHAAQLFARQNRYEDALRHYAHAVLQSRGKGHFDKSLEAYLTEKTGNKDLLQSRVRELGLKFRDQFEIKPVNGSFSWPANAKGDKGAFAIVAVMADEQGKVTAGRVVEGEESFRESALADVRGLQLPVIAWPGHTLPTVRSITFLYKRPGPASNERQVKAWWIVGLPPAGNVTTVSPDGEHVVSVPAAMASRLAGQIHPEPSSEVKSSAPATSYVDLMREGAELLMSRNTKAGIVKIREAVKLEPDCGFCHQALAEALMDKGDRAGAIVEYTELVRIEPNNADYHYMLGLQLEAQGATRANTSSRGGQSPATRADYEAAVAQYRIAHELAPDNKSYKSAYDRLRRQLKRT